MIGGKGRWDRLGIAASTACTIHCLVAPLLFLFLPRLADVWAHPASHALVALFVLPMAADRPTQRLPDARPQVGRSRSPRRHRLHRLGEHTPLRRQRRAAARGRRGELRAGLRVLLPASRRRGGNGRAAPGASRSVDRDRSRQPLSHQFPHRQPLGLPMLPALRLI